MTGRHNTTMNDYYEKYEKHKIEPPKLINDQEKCFTASSSTAALLAAKRVALSSQLTISKLKPMANVGSRLTPSSVSVTSGISITLDYLFGK